MSASAGSGHDSEFDSWPPPCYLPSMSSLRSRTKAKASARVRSWGVSLIRGSRAQVLGFVEASDAKAAEVAAIQAFKLDDWQRKRLLVWERA